MQIRIDEGIKEISIEIPLTKKTDEFSIKQKRLNNQYGFPLSTKTEPFSSSCYVEWQICYDNIAYDEESIEKKYINDIIFKGANGKKKKFNELSEYIFYFYKWNIIKIQDLESVKLFLEKLNNTDFLDSNNELAIEISPQREKKIIGIPFYFTQVKYPLLIHKLEQYEILIEISIKKKSNVIKASPMLYFCFPITELKTNEPILGRCAKPKETADFIINKNNIYLFILLLKIFGTLSKNHNTNILRIIDTILFYAKN
ncbi:MAG TPA: R.Pab1 family restriction endonuclease [bacterium]|mgnify:CR=1 FL=1|nr:R.Pab1 family restriction endonuclease [bacterium]